MRSCRFPATDATGDRRVCRDAHGATLRTFIYLFSTNKTREELIPSENFRVNKTTLTNTDPPFINCTNRALTKPADWSASPPNLPEAADVAERSRALNESENFLNVTFINNSWLRNINKRSEEMSDNNLFKDYCKAENSDDEDINSDLQTRLYAEIYYDSNIENKLENNINSISVQHEDIMDEATVDYNLYCNQDEGRETVMSEVITGKPTKIGMLEKHINQNISPARDCSVKKLLTHNDALSAPSSAHSEMLTDNQEFCLTERRESVEIPTQTGKDSLTNREMIDTTDLLDCSDSVLHEHNNINEVSTDSLVTDEIKSREVPSKKHKSSKHSKGRHQTKSHEDNTTSVIELDADTKYNVLQKNEKRRIFFLDKGKQSQDDKSDSEESISEVPIPPRPKPPLIDLQDSDDEDTANPAIEEDDLLTGKLWNRSTVSNSRVSLCRSPELEIIDVVANGQNISSRSKSINKPRCHKDTFTKYQSACNTRTPDISEDIVLNCMRVRKGAKSINEIKQLSKSTAMQENQKHATSEDTARRSQERTIQNISRVNIEDTSYTPQEMCATSSRSKSEIRKAQINLNTDKIAMRCNIVHDVTYNYRRADQDLTDNTLVEVSCDDSNLVMNRKRYSDNEAETQNSLAQKRQCITQQNDQSTMLALPGSSKCDETMKDRNDQSFWQNYFFKPLPEKLRKFYNDSRGQENFSINELQRGMSRDPRKWAILDEDLMPSPGRRGTRYWKMVRCSYCQQEGHTRKDCMESPKLICCYMCGVQGHTERCCPKKICLTCGRKQSTFRKNCEYCRVLYCTMCNSIGHKLQQCPDLWRRYHQTIETGRIPRYPGNVMKPTSQQYCCNCAKRGHEVSACMEYRWSIHFITPAAVTNYTDGPTYEPPKATANMSIESGVKTVNISSSKTDGNKKIPIAQRLRNLVTGTRTEHSSNTDALSTNACKMQTSQRIASTSGMVEYPAFSPNVSEPLSKVEEKTTVLLYRKVDPTFTRIIYSCGTLCEKNNKKIRTVMRDLSIHNRLGPHGIEFVSNSLAKGEVLPVFLETLQKVVKFKVTIGWINAEPGIMVQMIALKTCIRLLFNILFHWFNLPDDEKSYGLDVNLSTNPNETLELLQSRTLSTEDNYRNPLELFYEINDLKTSLKSTDQNAFTYLWNLQTELLMILNTQPKPTDYVFQFWKYLRLLKKVQTCKQIDTVIYLQIVLNYNYLFVPHTPLNITKMINRTLRQKQNITKPLEKKKGKTPANTSSFIPSMALCTSRGGNFADDSCITANIQNLDHNISVVRKDINDISLENGDMMKNCMPYSQNIASSNTQHILPSEDPTRNEDQLPIHNLGITSNIQMVDPNVHVNCIQTELLSKTMRRKLRKFDRNIGRNTAKLKNTANQNLDKRATRVLREARILQLPYIIKAANDLRKRMKDGSFEKKHIDTLQKMIKMERKHQNSVDVYNKFITSLK